MNDWISVEDRLPENGNDVLCYDAQDAIVYIDYLTCSKWFYADLLREVTHWTLLPAPPLEDKDA